MNYSIETHKEKDHCRVDLSGQINIYSALQLRDSLLSLFIENDKVLVNLQEVTDFDSSAVQVFILLKREAKRLEKVIKFANHSNVVLSVLDIYGLIGQFGDKIVVDKSNKDSFSFTYGIKKPPHFLKL